MTETLRSFNPLALGVAWKNRRWLIVHGEDVLKDFGSSEQEARQALRMIQELGVNQYGTIGSPRPVMEYWLIDGQAPVNLPRGGLVVQPLEPTRLKVEQTFRQWSLRDGVRSLFTFGDKEDDARRALEVIRKYGFTQIGTLGLGAPRMYVFFGKPTGEFPGIPATTSVGVSAGRMASPHFSRIAKNGDGTQHVEKPAPNGLQQMAPAVVPPLAVPGPARQPFAAASTSWHNPPHFGPITNSGAVGADRLAFDWRQVQLRLDGTQWKLTAGSHVLGNLGTNAINARLALAAMRYYRFTEQKRAGEDGAAAAYYLASPQAPRNVMLGLCGQSFQADRVEVRQVDGGFVVAEGHNVLVHFGPHREEAQKLADAIKREKYDRLCKVGDPGMEAMTMLVHSR
jgi:hypothetical protein